MCLRGRGVPKMDPRAANMAVAVWNGCAWDARRHAYQWRSAATTVLNLAYLIHRKSKRRMELYDRHLAGYKWDCMGEAGGLYGMVWVLERSVGQNGCQKVEWP